MKNNAHNKLVLIVTLTIITLSQDIRLVTEKQTINIATNGIINQSFYIHHRQLDCGMPELYIFADNTHKSYMIASSKVQIKSVTAQWQEIYSNVVCYESTKSCEAKIDNFCNANIQKHLINRVEVQTSIGKIQYLVDCKPQQFYKPFQIGLFLLILFSTITLTLSSIYSKAWSYSGYGYKLTTKTIIAFNILLFMAIIFGYLVPHLLSLFTQILGSILGAAGVTVCASELIWLLHNKKLKKTLFKKIRVIDIISGSIGLSFIPLYWLLNGNWMINDIMAVCSTVALMKLIKLQSLSQSTYLLLSLLIIQTFVGIFVHYIFKISYNNYIINLLQNPLMLVFPSITPQLYRKCAWIPISAIVFPGLLISYLRRFDKSRGTFLYFLIGLIAFYLGSLLWMLIDVETIHSLPFAIISQPITIFIIYITSFRRNQLRMLWRGTFHDEQLNQNIQTLIKKQTEIISPSFYANITDNLRISEDKKSSASYQVIVIDEVSK